MAQPAPRVPPPSAPNPPQTGPAVSRTVSQLLVEQLWQWGVRAIFGVQGPGVLGLTDAVRQQDRIRFIETRQELAAALMTSAHAKLTDRLSVCLGSAGPGVTNLITGLYDAATDRAPVLALCGEVDGARIGPHADPMIDQHALFQGIGCFDQTLLTPSQAAEVLMRASKAALEHQSVARFGFTRDTTQGPSGESAIGPDGHLIQERWAAPPQRVAQAADMLTTARRPMILAGWGARQARDAVARCAETFGAAVVTTCRAKGILPEAHPLALGVVGQFGSPAATAAVREADVLLVVGASLSAQTVPDGSLIGHDTRIIQIDVDPTVIGSVHPVTLALIGDAFLTLNHVVADATPTPRSAYRQELAERKRGWQVRIGHKAHSEAIPILPQRALGELSQLCTEDAIICLDAGACAAFYCQQFPVRNQSTLSSGHLRVLGFALPAANAAALARPARQAIALCGDDGFSVMMGEFLTSCQYHLPITVVLLNNHKMGLTAMRQAKAHFPAPGFFTGLADCDYAAFATSCGGLGLRVRRPDEIRPALEQALSAGVPSLVQIEVDPNEQPVPLVGDP